MRGSALPWVGLLNPGMLLRWGVLHRRGETPHTTPRAELNDRLHSGLKKLIGHGGCCFEREEKGENGPARMITDFLSIAKGTPADSPGTNITFLRYKFTSGRCHIYFEIVPFGKDLSNRIFATVSRTEAPPSMVTTFRRMISLA